MREKEESSNRNQCDLEDHRKSREKEISELKDAYKEKHRKCIAWEKAYNNIRDQVAVPTNHDPPAVSNQHGGQLVGRRFPPQQHPQSYPAQHQISHPEHVRDQQLNYSSPTPGTVGGNRVAQSSYNSPPSMNTNPAQTLRRTEVTTYRYISQYLTINYNLKIFTSE